MTALVCREISKSYGATRALDRFEATFAGGVVTALVGPNGAGKTTLLRICAALQRADSGSVSAPPRVVYYGGFDTLPLKGTVDSLRHTVALPPAADNGARKLKHLSRGQLHAAGLSIAFDLQADALLLDEPWTALDPDARDACSDRITSEVGNGRIVVCSTHDLDEVARIADVVVFLANGRAHIEQPDVLTRDALLETYRRMKRS